MDESGKPVRLTQWLVMVCAFTVAGALLGWGVGMLLSVLSADYVVMPADHAWLGLRTGFFGGTGVAAWHAITRQPRWGTHALGRVLGTTILAASGAVCLIAVLALLLSLVHGVVPEHANLGHPRRHVVFLAIHHLWPYATLFGIIVSCLRQWHRRPA